MAESIPTDWTTLKAFVDDRKLFIDWVEFDEHYHLVAVDGSISLVGSIRKTDPTNTDQDDFEDNYKDDGNKRPSTRIMAAESSKYRIDHLTKNQSLPKTSWTTVYTYTGSGRLWQVWVDVTSNKVDFKLEIDTTEVIVPEINLDDVSGFGDGGKAIMLPIVHLGSSNFAFTPHQAIDFTTKVELKLRTNTAATGDKTLTKGYMCLVKES